MNYSPQGLYVWDAWCMPVGDEVHLYHLQVPRPGMVVAEDVALQLGHAVSRDLVNWEERPACFGPNPDDPHDDNQPWTGCALWENGVGRLYYTMRGKSDKGVIQHIGMATTTDPDTWTRVATNPVITPDPQWYATEDNPVPGYLDCRDLLVIPDPAGGWLGFYATRVPGRELGQTSAIACVHSYDLEHWEHRPPAWVAEGYACVEVPDVFEINGLWFMTCLTGNFYGDRGALKDRHLTNGTIYAVAERPEGPYRDVAENVLLGARTTWPLSCRSVVFEGERYLLYTDRERQGHDDSNPFTMGTLATPKLLRADGERLYAAYSPRIETRVREELIGRGRTPVVASDYPWGQLWPHPHFGEVWQETNRGENELFYTGSIVTGWSLLPFATKAESFIFEATVTLENAAAAGLALRITDNRAGVVALLDAELQTVGYHPAPNFDWSEERNTPVPLGTPLHLRVVNRLEHIEIYVNDELRVAFSCYAGMGGAVGLFVDRGVAYFSDLRLRTLDAERNS